MGPLEHLCLASREKRRLYSTKHHRLGSLDQHHLGGASLIVVAGPPSPVSAGVPPYEITGASLHGAGGAALSPAIGVLDDLMSLRVDTTRSTRGRSGDCCRQQHTIARGRCDTIAWDRRVFTLWQSQSTTPGTAGEGRRNGNILDRLSPILYMSSLDHHTSMGLSDHQNRMRSRRSIIMNFFRRFLCSSRLDLRGHRRLGFLGHRFIHGDNEASRPRAIRVCPLGSICGSTSPASPVVAVGIDAGNEEPSPEIGATPSLGATAAISPRIALHSNVWARWSLFAWGRGHSIAWDRRRIIARDP